MNLPRLLRTVAHLRTSQVVNRFVRRLDWRRPSLAPPAALRQRSSRPVEFVEHPAEWDGCSTVHLLNQTGELGDWAPADTTKLWRYHLHYHNDLRRPDAATMRVKHLRLLQRWIGANPPGTGDGWEPYPLSLRIVNWVKWMTGDEPDATVLASLAVQIRALALQLEYHLRGNHLWANGKALFIGGLFFAGSEADAWRRNGARILAEEAGEQILSDGGHFERSPTYHAVILEDVMDILNLSRAYGIDPPFQCDDVARRMLGWLETMTNPLGDPVCWNDAAVGVAPRYETLAQYAARLGIAVAAPAGGGTRWLGDTGYARHDAGTYALWFDAGLVGPDYIPGHAHADTLNIELFARGHVLLMDTGVSTYEAGPLRAYERGTSAHNCVSVDAADSSEMWASFRVGRRARPFDICVGDRVFEAAHDGYAHRGATVRRRIVLGADRIVIRDTVEGPRLPSTAYFQLAPGIVPMVDGTIVEAGRSRLCFEGAQRVGITEAHVAGGFNVRVRRWRIAVDFTGLLTTTVVP